MALILSDRVKETTITEGTGRITLSGATFGGFQTFSDTIGDGNKTYYCIQNHDRFEIGLGTYRSSDNTLSRDTIFQSSNSDSHISIQGVGIVFCVIPADKSVYVDDMDCAVLPSPLVLKRSTDGDYWQTFSTDYANRIASFYMKEGSDTEWTLGLKTSSSDTIKPFYAYIKAKDGNVSLIGNSQSKIIIDSASASGLIVGHQLQNIIHLTKTSGEINTDSLNLNVTDTLSVNTNSISDTALYVDAPVGHISDLQSWNIASNEIASINQDGDFETIGSIISPSGRFSAIRFSDGTVQITKALPFASGSLIEQNAENIIIQSGYFQTYIDSQDFGITAVSGWARGYIDQTSGNLQSQITQNVNDISSLSGLIESADYLPSSSGSLIDQNASDIAVSSGALRDSINQNISDITTVSGLLSPSGESFDFTSNVLTYNNSYGGSFDVDLSSLATTDVSGEYMSYSNGVITYNDSAGGSFNVDISSISGDVYALIVSGAPSTLDTLNEIAAALNNDENIANTLTSLITINSNSILNNTASGVAISGNLQSQITENTQNISTVSGLLYSDVALSGYFESRSDTNDTQITAVSGWAKGYVDSQDHSAILVSGALQPQITQNSNDLLTVSGLLYDDTAISGYFESRADKVDGDILTVSGLLTPSGTHFTLGGNTLTYNNSYGGNFSVDLSSLTTGGGSTSGLPYTSGEYYLQEIRSNSASGVSISGALQPQITQNAQDIITVSGLTGGGGGTTYTAGSGITIDGSDNIHVYGGSGQFLDLQVRDQLNVSGVSVFNNTITMNSGVKTGLYLNADSATVTFNMNQSNSHSVTLGGNRTLAVSNTDIGQRFTLRLQQDTTGSRTVTWWDNITWLTSDGNPPTLKTSINAVDYLSFLHTSGTSPSFYDGFHLTEDASGSYASTSDLNYVSGIAAYASGQISVLENDIITVSGLSGGGGSYDDTYISGVSTFASGLALENQSNISTVSGLLYNNWNISDGVSSSDQILSNETVYISGISGVNTSYSNNLLKISANIPAGGLENQILYKVSDSSDTLGWIDNYATQVRAFVKNDTGSGILKGSALMATGAVGDLIQVAPAVADGSVEPRYMMGLASQDISNGSEGYVTMVGELKNIVTSGYPLGTILWIDPNTPGGLTSTRPTSPNLEMSVAIVTKTHATNGRIFVRMWEQQPGIHELHDVNVEVGLSSGDLLSYDSSDATWKNSENPSGILQNQITQNANDIVNISGIAAFASGLSVINESNIAANSGYFEDQVLELVGVSGVEATSEGSTVYLSAGSLSGYFQNYHISTTAASSSDNSGRTYIQDILLDDYGHVSGINTATETVTDTTYTAGSGLTLVGGEFNVYGGSGQFLDLNIRDQLNVSGTSVFDNTVTINSGIKTGLYSNSDGATITFDMNQSNSHAVTLGGDRTLAVSNTSVGQKFTLRLQQDAVGSRAVTWWDNIAWLTSDGSQPSLKTSSNSFDYFSFIHTSGSSPSFYDGFHLTEDASGSYASVADLNYVSGIADYASGQIPVLENDIITVSGLIGGGTTYTAGSGLTLVGDEFSTAGTGNFTKLTFDNEAIQLGSNSSSSVSGISIGINSKSSISGIAIGINSETPVYYSESNLPFYSFSDNEYKNISIGNNAGINSVAAESTFIGDNAGSGISVVGSGNLAGGYALYSGIKSSITIGKNSLSNYSYFYNSYAPIEDIIAIGTNSINNAGGLVNQSIAIGKSSAGSTKKFVNSIAIGYNAGNLNSGINNNYLGFGAGFRNYGENNIGIGYSALQDVTGDRNIEIKTTGTTSIIGTNNDKVHIHNMIVGDTSSRLYSIGNVGSADLTPDATLEIKPAASTDTGLIVQGATSQSANLQEWQDSSETKLLAVGPDGGLEIPNNVPSTTTNKLYNNAGTLTFNGSAVGGGGGSTYTAGSGITIDGSDNIHVYGGSGHFINLEVDGAFSAVTKSFLIDHPSKDGMRLQYASLEGPENGVYVRGTTDESFITLPDYWRDLVHNDSITVTLTPMGQFQPLFVEQKSNREIRVGGVCGHYDYVVYGERKDVDKLEVEW